MDEKQRRLFDRIDRTFDGVILGDGVSLHETSVIDHYGTDEERLAARNPDEKLDWRKLIDAPDLTRLFSIGPSGLSFLDAEGLRFHLPACLWRVVRDPEDGETGNMLESLMFQLTHLSEYTLGRLAILNDSQRDCVRDVLVNLRDVWELKDSELDRAIEDYWSQPAHP